MGIVLDDTHGASAGVGLWRAVPITTHGPFFPRKRAGRYHESAVFVR
jgi:hypothetical protein